VSSVQNSPAARERRGNATADAARLSPLPVAALAWLVPGAGHVLLGQMGKGIVFFVTLVAMFVIGLAFGGRLFPFQASEWLVFLAAIAQWGLGVPRVIATLAGGGAGDVVAVTYEYGNTFLIASGLLNALVVLDALDLASGRKQGPR
jgi:hypothetical protein